MENENWGEDIISLMDEEGNQSEYKIVPKWTVPSTWPWSRSLRTRRKR